MASPPPTLQCLEQQTEEEGVSGGVWEIVLVAGEGHQVS